MPAELGGDGCNVASTALLEQLAETLLEQLRRQIAAGEVVV